MRTRAPRNAEEFVGSGYVSVEQVAQRWNVATCWVRRRIRRGELPGLHVGGHVRVAVAEVVAYERRCFRPISMPLDAPGTRTGGRGSTHEEER